MVKNLIIKLLWMLGRFWSIIYSIKIKKYIEFIKIILYSSWVSNEFKYFGKGTRIYSFDYLLGGKYITIGDKSKLGKRTVLTAWDNYNTNSFLPQISIGNNVSIGDDSHITAINKICIGNNVLTGKKITITDNAHGESDLKKLSLPPDIRPLYSEGSVIIENNVWIGDKVTILPNVIIGEGCIIGANSVVTKSFPPFTIIGGVPARIIKNLTDNSL